MNRQVNSLYIGDENLTVEGQFTKHIGLIKTFGNININKITKDRPEFVGIDLETNHLTGELKLLGFYDGEQYDYYTKNFLGALFNVVKDANYTKKKLVYWNKLDPFVIFKQFLLLQEESSIETSLSLYQKISGSYNYETEDFDEDSPPIVEVEIGQYRFGILNVIRSSTQFFFIHKKYPQKINKVWAYDVAGIYLNGLETEGARFDYYSKVDKSAHLVDWDRFEIDKDYREKIVLTSNYLDARVVRDLAFLVVDNFYKIFNYYPRSLISNGTLARAGIVASVTNQNGDDSVKIIEELNSINIKSYYDEWFKNLGQHKFNDFLSLISESYSGGYIESISYGFTEQAFYSDIASAYPSIAVDLYDLRGAKITSGKGTPPHKKYSYCLIRGEVNIPYGTDYHPITVKHPILKDTNIRPTGEFIASYWLEERDYLLSIGATFKNETWYNIETTGVLSPLAKVVRQFLQSRTEFLEKGDSAEYIAKTCANSIYGILYEATKEYNLKDGNVVRSGFRGGEFKNDLFASRITALTRIKISEGTNAIKKAGGQGIVIMTDSIFWKGSIDMLPAHLWREKKTLGFFEKPAEIRDMTCLGSGRYEYFTLEGHKYRGKKRGLNIVDLIDENGIVLDEFNWRETVLQAIKSNNEVIKAKVRMLVSVGVVNGNLFYNYKDIGRVVEEEREVALIVGHTKRIIPKYELTDLRDKLVVTKPLHIANEDLTLKGLRELMESKTWETKEEREKTIQIESSKRYREKNPEKVKESSKKYIAKSRERRRAEYREKYQICLNKGLTPTEARKLAKKSLQNIKKELKIK